MFTSCSSIFRRWRCNPSSFCLLAVIRTVSLILLAPALCFPSRAFCKKNNVKEALLLYAFAGFPYTKVILTKHSNFLCIPSPLLLWSSTVHLWESGCGGSDLLPEMLQCAFIPGLETTNSFYSFHSCGENLVSNYVKRLRAFFFFFP